MAILSIPDPYKTAAAEAAAYDPTKAGSKGYDASTATTATHDPTYREVDSKDTVSGQMNTLLKSDSPYLTLLRSRAQATAARRGLLNSSIAAQAGETAGIEGALPIAQQDAQTYFNQGRANQDFGNAAGQFNAAETNKIGMFNADSKNKASEFGASAFNQSELFNAGEANKAGMFGADAKNKVSILNSEALNKSASDKFALDADLAKMNTDNANRDSLQADALANERAIKGIEQANLAFSQYIKGISDINATDMSPVAKEEAVRRLWDEYTKNSQIGVALSNATIANGSVQWADSGQTTGGAPPVGAPPAGTPPTSGSGSPNTTGTPSGTPQTGTSPTGAPTTPTGTAVNNPNDYFSYKTANDMPEYLRDSYKAKYGNIDPPLVKKVVDTGKWLKDKSGYKNGQALSENKVSRYLKDVQKELKANGVSLTETQIRDLLFNSKTVQRSNGDQDWTDTFYSFK